MTASEYLSQCLEYKMKASRYNWMIASTIRQLERIDIEHMPNNKEAVKKYNAVLDGIKRLRKDEARYKAMSDEVAETIQNIPGIEGDILRLRYIDGMRWEDISEEVVYSLCGVFNIHDRALKLVDEIIADIEAK